MDVKSRILRALVTSAAQDGPRIALDLTRQGVAARTLERLGVDCRRMAHTQELFGLVVCNPQMLPRLMPRVQADGSIIVHIRPGQHDQLVALSGEFTLVASARTPSGAWVQLRRTGDPRAITPRVSVVVAVRNDAAALAQLLRTLEDQPTDPAWELVAVDRGSTDATGDLLDHVSGNLRRIRVARDTDPLDALFAGLRVSHGDLLLPIPAGLVPGCGFVSALLRHADHQPPTEAPLLGRVVSMDGRRVPGGVARAVARSMAPTTPRRLARWLHRTDGTIIPGFRLRQIQAGPLPSIGRASQRLDGAA